jgi:iron complex transport system substrate-binding protein
LRIVSLLPSASEIVCALGFESAMVGRSHECDFPASLKPLPICTEPKFNVEGSSYEIDQRVKAILREALSVYRVDAEVLRDLRPDVIVTQAQCEVCAVNIDEVERVAETWTGLRPNIVSLCPNSLEDIWADIQRVADELGVSDRGVELIASLKRRFDQIAQRARKASVRPTISCIEWLDPLMAAGNWMPELVEKAGGINLFGNAGQHSPWLDFEDVAQKDPDVILLSPCGFDIPRCLADLPALASQPGWNTLKAVRNSRVYVADGNQYFNRPGPRLAESLEILAEILHPDLFDFGHKGKGWQSLTTPASSPS